MAHLLMHEPDPRALAANAASLRAHGFAVEEAPALEGLRRRLQAARPDMLLVGDVRPGGAAAAALEAADDVQAVAYGPECDPAVMNWARERGASGFFQAPLVGAVLAPKLRRLLSDRRVVWIDDLSSATAPLGARPNVPTAPAITLAPPLSIATAPDDAFAGLNPTIAALAAEYGAATVELLLAALQKQLAGLDLRAAMAADLAESARNIGDAAACLGFTTVRDACFALDEACAYGDEVEPKLVRAAALCANARVRIQTCLAQAA